MMIPDVVTTRTKHHLTGLGCVDAASCAIQLGMKVMDYWRAQSLNNKNKVLATNDAEGFVAAFYGATSANCQIKVNNVAVWQTGQPQAYLSSLTHLPVTSGYKFCENSIGGLIERCRINEAQMFLGLLIQDMQELKSKFTYFANWYFQYGMNDIIFLQTKINDARSMCGTSDPTYNYVNGSPATGSGSTGGGGGTYIPPSGGGLDSSTTLMGLAAIAGIGLIMMMRN